MVFSSLSCSGPLGHGQVFEAGALVSAIDLFFFEHPVTRKSVFLMDRVSLLVLCGIGSLSWPYKLHIYYYR